ncbi:hypothetical protein KY289_027235 [Solanum tuberosum]|nr:hypothetical protein KY289_027235 [Solanum tuberosum]
MYFLSCEIQVKGEYRDLVMFNMQLGLGIARCSKEMSGMLSTCTYAQLITELERLLLMLLCDSLSLIRPGPVWEKYPNTELRDYVWDLG